MTSPFAAPTTASCMANDLVAEVAPFLSRKRKERTPQWQRGGQQEPLPAPEMEFLNGI
jgi:hypothetical protein